MTITPPPEYPSDLPVSEEQRNDPPPERRHRRWVWIVVIAVAALLAWFGYRWHNGKNSADTSGSEAGPAKRSGRKGFAARGAMPVGVAKIVTDDVNVYLNALGTVTPLATTTVRARVNGQLSKILFKEGQFVKQGTVLAELDPRPYQVLVTQAEGTVARDAAQLKSAQLDLKRYQTLLNQDSIASQQVDTQAALVGQYGGTLLSDQGNLDNARLNLSYTHIVAPISGRVGLRQTDLGNNVSTSDTTGIVVITQLDPITAVFSLPEDNVPKLMAQLQAGVTLPAEAWNRQFTTRLSTGSVLTADNQIDTTTGTVKVKATFQNADFSLYPNQFVNIKLLLDTHKSVVVAPTSAIQTNSTGTFVYVLKPDNTVTIQQVVTGVTEGGKIEITKGLATNVSVVIDGLDSLKEGAKVEPVVRDGKPAAPAADAKKNTAHVHHKHN